MASVPCGEFVMTFFEAALEVLRTAQRPLDYKTITQFAISRQLLGHVGHTPDVVMASCLLRAVDRCETGALIRLETGEFALRGWPEEVLARAALPRIPESTASVEFPAANPGLADEPQAMALLEKDDIQFRKAVQMKFERNAFGIDDPDPAPEDDVSVLKFEQLRNELNAQKNSHFNLCAAIVKILRQDPTPMRSSQLASTLSQKLETPVFEQSVVLAMRADNALRVSRGKRAVFMHIPPDLWTLTENFLASYILKLESKLYDLSRQLRIYSLHALSSRLRELSPQAWLQLAVIIMKHLNFTILSQCQDAPHAYVFRAEEARGLTYIPVVIKVLHTPLVETSDVIEFRAQLSELGYDHGVLMTNGEFSRDALNECTTKDLPVYAYSSRQIAPIMLDARIGVTPHELPIVFIDNNFFQALSSKDALKNNPPSHDHSPNHAPNRAPSLDDSANPSPKPDADLEAVYEELDEKVTSGEFLYIDKATLDSPKV